MLQKIADIKNALSVGAYQSALALTLSLPDIFCNVEYGDARSGSIFYPAWVDKYVDFSKC